MGMFLRRGTAPHRTRMSDLEIRKTIKLNLNGTPWDWLVVHQGLPSSIYDASCDGTWLLMKDIYENRARDSSDSSAYATSTVNTYLNSPFLGLFDSDIQSAIKQVKIPYCIGGGSSTVNSGASGLPAKIFLLGSYEVGWSTSDSKDFPVDGAKLAYFTSGTGTSANNKRIANFGGSAAIWWLRSSRVGYSEYARCVYSDGSYASRNPSVSIGIRPAIILPSDMLVTDDMLAV